MQILSIEAHLICAINDLLLFKNLLRDSILETMTKFEEVHYFSLQAEFLMKSDKLLGICQRVMKQTNFWLIFAKTAFSGSKVDHIEKINCQNSKVAIESVAI